MRTLAWGSAIAGGAALLGGAVALGLQRSYASQFNGPSGTGQYTPDTCQPMSPCATTQTQANTAEAFVWVGFIAGGVLAGASAILFATMPSDAPAERAGLSCGEGPGLVGVSCTARF